MYKNSRKLESFSAPEKLVVDTFRNSWPVALKNITTLKIGDVSKQSGCSEKELVKKSFKSMFFAWFSLSFFFQGYGVQVYQERKFPENFFSELV